MVNIDYVDNLFNNNNRILETIRKMVKVTLKLRLYVRQLNLQNSIKDLTNGLIRKKTVQKSIQ